MIQLFSQTLIALPGVMLKNTEYPPNITELNDWHVKYLYLLCLSIKLAFALMFSIRYWFVMKCLLSQIKFK